MPGTHIAIFIVRPTQYPIRMYNTRKTGKPTRSGRRHLQATCEIRPSAGPQAPSSTPRLFEYFVIPLLIDWTAELHISSGVLKSGSPTSKWTIFFPWISIFLASSRMSMDTNVRRTRSYFYGSLNRVIPVIFTCEAEQSEANTIDDQLIMIIFIHYF